MFMVMERSIANKVDAMNLRGRFLVLGICLIALGMAAIASVAVSTIAIVLYLGCFLLAAGIAQVIHAVQARRFGRLLPDLLLAAVYVTGGALLVWNPAIGALSATFVIAVFLAAMGILKMLYAMTMREFLFRFWGWLLLAGMTDLALSALIWLGWPSTAHWVLGLFVGIQMLFHGSCLLALCAACNHVKLYILE